MIKYVDIVSTVFFFVVGSQKERKGQKNLVLYPNAILSCTKILTQIVGVLFFVRLRVR